MSRRGLLAGGVRSAVGLSAFPAGTLLSPPSAQALAKVGSNRKVFIDPATEYQVTRWTEESADAHLPMDPNRALAGDDKELLYTSNRSGSWQPYILELKSGSSEQTGEAKELRPRSLALLRDGKDLLFLDGDSLVRNQIRKGRSRELYRSEDGWHPTGSLLLAPDDHMTAILERRDTDTRVVFVDPASGRARPVLTATGADLLPLGFHQRWGLLVLDSSRKPTLIGQSGAPQMPAFPEGKILQARWDRTGRLLMYLLATVEGEYERVRLMEYDLDSGEHRLVANTSKFATFSPNADSSVFVGASSSVAQPFLLLLLRVTRREFSLMEHHASDAAAVDPFFSNDSQTIFFQSDRLGKRCIFSMSVKGLVEET